MICNEEKENSVTDTAAAVAAAEEERRERDILARQRLTEERVGLQARIVELTAFITAKSDSPCRPTQFQRLDEITQGLLFRNPFVPKVRQHPRTAGVPLGQTDCGRAGGENGRNEVFVVGGGRGVA